MPCVAAPSLATLRAGRLIETATGLVDLATGCAAHLASRVIDPAEAHDWQPIPIGASSGPPGHVVVDAWLTRDWLGRWMERVLTIASEPAPWAATASWTWPAVDSSEVLMARTHGAPAWCRAAAAARAAGLLPVQGEWLAALSPSRVPAWPPLLLAVRDPHGVAGRAGVDGWVAAGGRVGAIFVTAGLPGESQPPLPAGVRAPPPSRWPVDARSRAHARQVRRAWRRLASAPPCPSYITVAPPAGERAHMTHLELLDVNTQLDDVRRDEEALVVACRAVRHHAHADHAAILVTRHGEARLLASDGPPGDSLPAWRQLCQADAPDALATGRGWHSAGRHDLEGDAALYVCACWPSSDAGRPRQPLLAVFARLVAGRVGTAIPAVAPAAPGLEGTLVGDSVVMRDVRAQIALAARAPFPVLVRGESGCGKELAARAIHALGQRRHRRCAAINCAALPDDLIESELFGHVRGAFTGAANDRMGLFDEADGGTLFLDEVGELGARAQAKLLRVLQDGEVRRVGENHPRRVDVRVIAATNVSLDDAVRRGVFRADLFYRLDVVRVRMPALRERREDIPLLARHLWQDCAARVGCRARLDDRVLDALARQDWPGNVRQLQNTLAALAVRGPSRGRVMVDDLPPEVRRPSAPAHHLHTGLDAARREFEASYVRDALSRAGGRPSQAARDLGLTRQGLSKLVRRLGLDPREEGPRLP